jgi:hypothetical protein
MLESLRMIMSPKSNEIIKNNKDLESQRLDLILEKRAPKE